MPANIEIPARKEALKTRDSNGQREIWDPIRKVWVVLTPEELVRQLVLVYLIQDLAYPAALIAVEKGIKLNNQQKRCDIIIYNRDGQPLMIVECKAPAVNISQSTFDQIARYNLTLQVPYLFVSNGHTGYCCRVDLTSGDVLYMEEIPDFNAL